MFRYTHDGNYWEWHESGEGVFVVDLCRNSRKQLTGTCQFSVRGLSEKYARRKIRKFMKID